MQHLGGRYIACLRVSSSGNQRVVRQAAIPESVILGWTVLPNHVGVQEERPGRPNRATTWAQLRRLGVNPGQGREIPVDLVVESDLNPKPCVFAIIATPFVVKSPILLQDIALYGNRTGTKEINRRLEPDRIHVGW